MRPGCGDAGNPGFLKKSPPVPLPCGRPGEKHDRTRIQIARHARLQPYPPDRGSICRSRNPAHPVPEAGPEPGRRQEHVPARVRGRRRALRPLLLHRPAGEDAAAHARQRDDGREERRSHRDARRQSARLHRTVPGPLQGRAAPGPAPLLRRPRGLLRLRHGAPHREEAGAQRAEGRPRPAGNPAARDGRTGRHRQPVRQAVPDRLRRSDAAGSLQQGAPAVEGPAHDAAPERRRAGHDGLRAHRSDPRLQQGRLSEGRRRGEGIRDGGRPDAGADRPAHPQAVRGFAAVAVPFAAFAEPVAVHIVGSSPEILVRNEAAPEGGRTVTVRPIAGTRPRGATPERDAELAHELLNDPKEVAEHVMLIDLARNDIGRIAKTGSVKVTDQMVIEKYSHVQHIVSNVEGLLKDGMSNLDVLRATFPAGTLTGAPKVRAMEVIDELEPVKRGIYGGACGYLSFGGEMDVAIAIRTGVIKDGNLYVQAAAGIVADSIPEMEWLETENKARAVLRAAEQVQDGLDGEI
ncbi:hypothetical protein Lal_00014778 [Lupinus albus]|nr:hypothetical protein Lal_00014778 [Lupinus albus]